MSQLVVFYDGGCPLCRREIAHYRRIDRQSAIRWVDIISEKEALDAAGLDLAAAMRRIHAREADGRLVSGVTAFVAVWRRLPFYRHLASLIDGLRLTAVLDRMYGRFADWRLKRRCAGGRCAAGPQDQSWRSMTTRRSSGAGRCSRDATPHRR
jgi:predicted DCC family thiol-disulfide oxidoreductase YuxK